MKTDARPPFRFDKDLKQSTMHLEKAWLTTKLLTLLGCDNGNVAHSTIKRKIQAKAKGRIGPINIVLNRVKTTKEEANA